ncbi:MAG: CPBP family intramembrane metalloprotease [Myxococcales bacterium]|nr:CPBP family intramembrane metalloprotease [Myxococcales bacterium]
MVLAYGVVMMGVVVAVALAAVRHRKALRPVLRAGLVLSAVVLLLSAPQLVLRLLFFDPFAAWSGEELPPGLSARMMDPMRLATAVGALLAAALWFAWRAVAVGVTEWADGDRPAFPWLTQRGRPWPVGVALGTGVGGLCVAWSWVTQTPLAGDVPAPVEWFPGVDLTAPVVVWGVGLPRAWAQAMSEELLFRGVIQRWTGRWLGGTPVAMGASVAVSTALWTFGRASTTDAPLLTVLPLLVVGAVLGVVAQRRGVEASMGVHVALATVVLAAGALATW